MRRHRCLKNQVIVWDSSIGKKLIEENYIDICGLNKNRAALQKKSQYALECLYKALEQSEIKLLVSSYDNTCIHDGKIEIDGFGLIWYQRNSYCRCCKGYACNLDKKTVSRRFMLCFSLLWTWLFWNAGNRYGKIFSVYGVQ